MRTAETNDDRLRREGRADAAVLLVAHKTHPTMTLAEWARSLDIDEIDLQHAVKRFKQRAANASAAKRPNLQAVPNSRTSTSLRRTAETEEARQQRGQILATLDRLPRGRIDSESGGATPALREATGLDVSRAVFVLRLVELDTAGEITRDVRGRRTFSITRVTTNQGEAS